MRHALVALVVLLTASLRADEAIPAKTLAEIKGATVFIKVQAGPLRATGSGFLMQLDGKTGYVVTNHHVVVHNRPGPAKGAITAVFWSGTRREQSYPAELLASDPDRDLAVLKIADARELPAPIDLAQKVELTETLPVFTFGFPFGEALSLTKGNPAITVGKASISSLRMNDRDEVGVIQIDGDLNPGNSGGPVVDGKGRLVGVAVAKIRNTRIGMAIPPAELAHMLAGRVGSVRTKSVRVNETATDLEVEVSLIDPLGKIKEAELLFAPARSVKDKPKQDRETLWTAMTEARRMKLTLSGQKASGKARVNTTEKGVVPFAVQVSILQGEGKRLITQLATHDVDFGKATVVVKPDPLDPPPPPIVLKDRVVQAMPASIGNAVIGGNGRYLILHLPEKRRLVVWDVHLSKVTKELALAADNVKITAGMDKLIVILPEQKLIQRYSLKTFEREVTQPLRVKGKVTGLALGSASSGPLLLGVLNDAGAETGEFLDPLTLQPLEYDWGGVRVPGLSGEFLRASANGQVFTARQGVGGEPHTCVALIINGRKVKVIEAWPKGSLLLPTPDGQHICMEQGMLDAQLKQFGPRSKEENGESPFLPAYQGKYVMHFESGAGAGIGKLSLYLLGHDRPIGVIDEVEGYVGKTTNYGRLPDPMMHDKRVFFVPDAKQLITIPLSNDRLIIRPLDVDAVLAKATFDFLFVTSNPPLTARESTAYTYQVSAKSNKGGIKYKLESGPRGMKVSPQGLVEWEVPKKTDRTEYEVIVGITDAAGQECFHTFTITID